MPEGDKITLHCFKCAIVERSESHSNSLLMGFLESPPTHCLTTQKWIDEGYVVSFRSELKQLYIL
jgi:hypothetical protein